MVKKVIYMKVIKLTLNEWWELQAFLRVYDIESKMREGKNIVKKVENAECLRD